jgi:hypothetical protein
LGDRSSELANSATGRKIFSSCDVPSKEFPALPPLPSPPSTTDLQAEHQILTVALVERVEKLRITKSKLERDLLEASKVVSSLDDQIGTVNKEVAVLVKVLKGYGVEAGEVTLDEFFSVEFHGSPKRGQQFRQDLSLSAADRLRVLADNETTSNARVNKQVVIEQAKQILDVMESMHVRDLHGVLSDKMVENKLGEVPTWQRLSQILSGSEEFESDRTKGWSLKK